MKLHPAFSRKSGSSPFLTHYPVPRKTSGCLNGFSHFLFLCFFSGPSKGKVEHETKANDAPSPLLRFRPQINSYRNSSFMFLLFLLLSGVHDSFPRCCFRCLFFCWCLPRISSRYASPGVIFLSANLHITTPGPKWQLKPAAKWWGPKNKIVVAVAVAAIGGWKPITNGEKMGNS